MDVVKVSPKYQVVILLSIRRVLGIKPGTKVHILQYENRIEYIPVSNVQRSAFNDKREKLMWFNFERLEV